MGSKRRAKYILEAGQFSGFQAHNALWAWFTAAAQRLIFTGLSRLGLPIVKILKAQFNSILLPEKNLSSLELYSKVNSEQDARYIGRRTARY